MALPQTEGAEGEAEALSRIDAVPAWDAVVERGRYMARRGERGAIIGQVGEFLEGSEPAQRWLIDTAQGEGALRVRLALDPRLELASGRRVVVWGAWKTDAERRWYWAGERVAALPERDPAELPVAEPFGILELAEAPEQAVPVSQLEGDGEILFQLARRPRVATDGWEIADPGSRRAVARLLLPGDDRSYGAQDYRSGDEYWQLEPGTVYTVVTAGARGGGEDELPTMRARGVPRRVLKRP